MPKELHVRIDEDSKPVLAALTQKDGPCAIFEDRSAAYAVNELLKTHPSFKAAVKQIASERHPRPTDTKR